MLDLPVLPSELRYIPKSEVDSEKPTAFIYAPINQAQRVKLIAWSASLFGTVADVEGADDDDNSRAVDAIEEIDWGFLFEVFNDCVLRAENLNIGGEPFDPKTDRHVESLIAAKPNWAMEVAMAITRGAHVSEDELGN